MVHSSHLKTQKAYLVAITTKNAATKKKKIWKLKKARNFFDCDKNSKSTGSAKTSITISYKCRCKVV